MVVWCDTLGGDDFGSASVSGHFESGGDSVIETWTKVAATRRVSTGSVSW